MCYLRFLIDMHVIYFMLVSTVTIAQFYTFRKGLHNIGSLVYLR
jgi:hypothetical protein